MTRFDIKLENIGISFNQHSLLKNINLSINESEIFVIIGPSGSGKSVLLKIIAGLINPTQGNLFIGGENFLTLGAEFQNGYRKKMGMLFQKNALFDSLTIFENLEFPLRETTNLSEDEIRRKVVFFLKEVDLLAAKDLFPDAISGGMQKRVGIARALILDPKIIFYDDPTAGLDPITSRKIIQLILTLQQKSKATVVAITNDMNRAYQMASKIGIILDQTLIPTGNIEETKQNEDERVQQFIKGLTTGPLVTL